MSDKEFIEKYEKLLNCGYCECNELNCLDNNPPRRILNIMKEQQNINEKLSLALESAEHRLDKAIEYIETHQLNFKKGTTTFGSERLSMEERKLLDILRGEDK